MNKIFKFRAKVIDSDKLDAGRIVYGSLVDHGESNHCPRYWIYPTDGDRNFPVDSNSIAQFIGFDRGGNEVYEGDELIRSDGTKWTASLEFLGYSTNESHSAEVVVNLKFLSLVRRIQNESPYPQL